MLITYFSIFKIYKNGKFFSTLYDFAAHIIIL